MSGVERLRALFQPTGRTPHAGRYRAYGLYDAHTGGRIAKSFPTRSAAEAAKSSSKDPHRLRVRGVPWKSKPKRAKIAKASETSES